MILPYDDKLKEMITAVLEEGIEGRNLFYQPPKKIYFEENEYLPRQFLAEVKNRSLVGEKILQYVHNQISTGLEKLLQGIENPDEIIFAQLDKKKYLLGVLKQDVPEMFGFAYRDIMTEEI